MRPPLLALLLALAVSIPARAGGEPVLLVAPLVVNDEVRGEAVVLRDGDDVLMREPDLAAAGVQTARLRGNVVRVGAAGEDYVSLASLAPAVRFALDERAVVLRLSARPELLGNEVFDLSSRARGDGGVSREQAPALFVNYGVQGFDLAREEARGFAASGEVGATFRGMLAYSSASRLADGTIARGLSSISVDARGRAARFVFGDSLASTSGLGGGGFVGGVQYARHFEIDPWLQRTPLPGLAGAAETPSTLEVYVDDVLVRTEHVAPGTFEVRNLPVMASSGATRYVLRDAFGREREVLGSYTVGSSLLVRGLSDFSYTFGARRGPIGTDGPEYGDLVFLGAHRLGLTDGITAGLRLEAAPDLVSGGGGLVLRLPLGLLSLETGASRVASSSGAAGAAIWALAGRRFGFSLQARAMSARYAHTSLDAERDRALLDAGGGLSVPLGRIGGVNLDVSRRWMRDQGAQDRQTLGTSWRVASGVSLGISGTRTGGAAQTSYEAYASLALMLRRGATAQTWARASGDRSVGGLDVQERSGADVGWEYRAGLTQGDVESIDARAGYRGTHGQAFADVASQPGRAAVGAEVAGSLVAVGDRVFLARPIDRSFALVRVPGVPDATVRLNNREVGTTDRNGELLVVGLQSYDANLLSIDPDDVPFDMTFGDLRAVVAPPQRGAAIAHFAVRRIRAIRGTFVRRAADGKSRQLAYGELSVRTDAGISTYPLGSDGRFEVELPGGRFTAEVHHRDGRCSAALVVPESAEAIVDVGVVSCTDGVSL